MANFYRGNFSQLWITLRADETLGDLDGSYIEDYFGVPGQISLMLPDSSRMPVLMSELLSATPSTPHDVFTGAVDLNGLANGHYIVQGRVRDVLGNYSILSAIENPLGDERIIGLEFDIVPGFGVVISFGTLKLTGGVAFDVRPPARNNAFEAAVLNVSFQLGRILSGTTFTTILEREFSF